LLAIRSSKRAIPAISRTYPQRLFSETLVASLWLSLWLRNLDAQLKNEETPSSSGKTGQNRVVANGADERA
jgi:hypothetical protein